MASSPLPVVGELGFFNYVLSALQIYLRLLAAIVCLSALGIAAIWPILAFFFHGEIGEAVADDRTSFAVRATKGENVLALPELTTLTDSLVGAAVFGVTATYPGILFFLQAEWNRKMRLWLATGTCLVIIIVGVKAFVAFIQAYEGDYNPALSQSLSILSLLVAYLLTSWIALRGSMRGSVRQALICGAVQSTVLGVVAFVMVPAFRRSSDVVKIIWRFILVFARSISIHCSLYAAKTVEHPDLNPAVIHMWAIPPILICSFTARTLQTAGVSFTVGCVMEAIAVLLEVHEINKFYVEETEVSAIYNIGQRLKRKIDSCITRFFDPPGHSLEQVVPHDIPSPRGPRLKKGRKRTKRIFQVSANSPPGWSSSSISSGLSNRREANPRTESRRGEVDSRTKREAELETRTTFTLLIFNMVIAEGVAAIVSFLTLFLGNISFTAGAATVDRSGIVANAVVSIVGEIFISDFLVMVWLSRRAAGMLGVHDMLTAFMWVLIVAGYSSSFFGYSLFREFCATRDVVGDIIVLPCE